jgi:hypothetical protein
MTTKAIIARRGAVRSDAVESAKSAEAEITGLNLNSGSPTDYWFPVTGNNKELVSVLVK